MLTRKLSVLALALLLALPFASAFSGCCGKCNEEELSKELEKELDVAKAALTRAIMQKELLENMAALRGVPSVPTRSRK